jgi:hypothetical protein
MAIPSVFAEAGFATGADTAGGAGALAVVGCGVTGFLSPHIFWPPRSEAPNVEAGAGPGCKSLYRSAQKWNGKKTGVVFL